MLYVDQKCRVWSDAARVGNEIRVTFNETNSESVTLALSFHDAVWLAENIQREVRRIEWACLKAKSVELTDASRMALDVGDRVIVIIDNGTEADYIVKSTPWRLVDGTLVVGLRGITGGYLLRRVIAKIPT